MDRMKTALSRIEMEHPLFHRVTTDSRTHIFFRPYDARWAYSGLVNEFQAGFNPLNGKIYTHQNSLLARWIRKGAVPEMEIARKILLKETLFLVHDYLHQLAFREIAAFPGAATIPNYTRERNLVFFLLISEAVATVVLDYWILSKLNLSPLYGLSDPYFQLTIQLNESQVREIKSIAPDFSIDRESLFSEICRFYLEGEMQGFDIQDLENCPALQEYLVHELRYVAKQRRYARRWAASLTGTLASPFDDSPVLAQEPWQNDLIGHIGKRVWSLTTRGELDDSNASLQVDRISKLPGFPSDPRLVCIEKFVAPDSSAFLKHYPGADELVLSMIDYNDISDSERQQLIFRFITETHPLSMDWIATHLKRPLESFARVKSDDLVASFDDHVFCLP